MPGTSSNQKKSLLKTYPVYYTDFGQTADAYIEKKPVNLCALVYVECCRGELPLVKSPYQSHLSRLIVATSDRGTAAE